MKLRFSARRYVIETKMVSFLVGKASEKMRGKK
jgi:hypothetical protein